MRKFLVLTVALLTSGCGEPQSEVGMLAEGESGSVQLPFDASTGFLDGYLLQVDRHGNLRWNGSPINEAQLEEYLAKWAELPPEAGRLSVAFEPGIAKKRANWVRSEVIRSGLCQQQRCAEVDWTAKRPVILSGHPFEAAKIQSGLVMVAHIAIRNGGAT